MASGASRSHRNPLRDERDKRLPRIAGPCSMVIFGVTGDLSRRKLMPAIYDLANRGLLPSGFALVGFARRDWADEDFAKIVYDAVRANARTPFREDVWRELSAGFRFGQGTFDGVTLEEIVAEEGADLVACKLHVSFAIGGGDGDREPIARRNRRAHRDRRHLNLGLTARPLRKPRQRQPQERRHQRQGFLQTHRRCCCQRRRT